MGFRAGPFFLGKFRAFLSTAVRTIALLAQCLLQGPLSPIRGSIPHWIGRKECQVSYEAHFGKFRNSTSQPTTFEIVYRPTSERDDLRFFSFRLFLLLVSSSTRLQEEAAHVDTDVKEAFTEKTTDNEKSEH